MSQWGDSNHLQSKLDLTETWFKFGFNRLDGKAIDCFNFTTSRIGINSWFQTTKWNSTAISTQFHSDWQRTSQHLISIQLSIKLSIESWQLNIETGEPRRNRRYFYAGGNRHLIQSNLQLMITYKIEYELVGLINRYWLRPVEFQVGELSRPDSAPTEWMTPKSKRFKLNQSQSKWIKVN